MLDILFVCFGSFLLNFVSHSRPLFLLFSSQILKFSNSLILPFEKTSLFVLVISSDIPGNNTNFLLGAFHGQIPQLHFIFMSLTGPILMVIITKTTLSWNLDQSNIVIHLMDVRSSFHLEIINRNLLKTSFNNSRWDPAMVTWISQTHTLIHSHPYLYLYIYTIKQTNPSQTS
jgi:hypothetical protein